MGCAFITSRSPLSYWSLQNTKRNNPDCSVKIRIRCTPGDNLLILCCAAAGCAVQVACGSHLKVPLPGKQTALVLWDFPNYCTWERQGLPTTVLFCAWVAVRFGRHRSELWVGQVTFGQVLIPAGQPEEKLLSCRDGSKYISSTCLETFGIYFRSANYIHGCLAKLLSPNQTEVQVHSTRSIH